MTDIKKQIETIPCFSCGTKLVFKSVEFDEDFKCGTEATVAVDVHCKPCDTYPVVVLQINVE
ncbi:hypothetical protein CSV74_04840 [Sporosarcina sp. P19]|nr:hypothetical protein CSV74_04840 [Sporosarcina sp. P19]